MSTEVESSEIYQPVEPTIPKATASFSILTTSASCQTIVSGDNWVTESSIARAIIDSDMERIACFARHLCNGAEDAPEHLKEQTLLWQIDYTILQNYMSLLRLLRIIVEHYREDVLEQRHHADEASLAVSRLEQMINMEEENYVKTLKLREKEYQNRIDALFVGVTAPEKGSDVPDVALDDTDKNQASPVSLNRLLPLIGR
jgi:hypothetical protein